MIDSFLVAHSKTLLTDAMVVNVPHERHGYQDEEFCLLCNSRIEELEEAIWRSDIHSYCRSLDEFKDLITLPSTLAYQMAK